MNTITIKYFPFVTAQKVTVYNEEYTILEELNVPLNQISNAVKGLVSQYDVREIDMIGNQEYLSKFKAEMLNQFSDNKININII